MVPEASLEVGEGGLFPAEEGWFVVNARDARWFHVTGSGYWCPFESKGARFAQLGININVMAPGEVMSLYHAEEAQEDFLVLSGECLLIVEGQERALRAWDFVHCPPWTEHVFVGTGGGPCVVLAVGARRKGRRIKYPANDIALKHRAGVEEETSDPKVAYARFDEPVPIPCPEELFA